MLRVPEHEDDLGVPAFGQREHAPHLAAAFEDDLEEADLARRKPCRSAISIRL
jgi:hypothetical protein